MKFKKEWIVFIFVFSIVLTSIPNYTNAIITYAEYGPTTVEGSDGEHVMVFVQDRISNEVSVDQHIKSRTMRRLPTEFQIEEINDTEIMLESFNFNGTDYYTNQTDVVYLDGVSYLFIAAHDQITDNLTFFALTSENNGVSWGELALVYNTSVTYGNDTYYAFDAINKDDGLVLSYSYGAEVNLSGIIYYVVVNDVLEIDPDTLEITDTFYVASGFGKDFQFYNHNDDLLVIYSEESGLTSTVQFDQLDDSYSIVSSIITLDPPNNLVILLQPTVTYWLDRFYVVAQDNLADVVDADQGIIKIESFLWGTSFKVEQGFFGLEAISSTIQEHNVIKSIDNFDGYYRKDPCLSVYEDRLFLTFIVGRGSRFGSKGWPGAAFAFSADGDTWTNNYLGEYSFFMNLGTYFVIGTVGLFAVVYPSYLVYSKKTKG